jgi:hypothetical protein
MENEMTSADVERFWNKAQKNGETVRFRDHKTGEYFYPATLEEAIAYATERTPVK